MPENLFVGPVARGYDAGCPEMFDPALLERTTAFLATAAQGGRALELGVGTGRVALPLSRRGVEVAGIDISADMVDLLRAKPGGGAVTTVVGDFATTLVPGQFALVYVVYNTIANLLEQSEWVATFRNAARHLRPGGRFVVELWVPDLRRFPPGAAAVPFDVRPGHLGFDTLDLATQRGVSHHYVIAGDGQVHRFETPFRFGWPAELDLMAELAGMTLRERWADWDRTPFTGDSRTHVSVWERP